MRFEPARVGPAQIVKRYDNTPFTVSVRGAVATVARRPNLEARAWTDPSQPAGAVRVRLEPAGGHRFAEPPVLTLPDDPQGNGLKLVEPIHAVEPSPTGPKAPEQARQFAFRLAPAAETGTGTPNLVPTEPVPGSGEPLAVPIRFEYVLQDAKGNRRPDSGTLEVAVAVPRPANTPAPAAQSHRIPRVAGTLEIGLGHLCDQRGCVEHLHQSVEPFDWLAGVRPRPSLEEPRASLIVRAGQPIDLWALRTKLREQGVEARSIRPEDLGPFAIHIDLGRWQTDEESADVRQCATCRALALEAATSTPGTRAASVAAGGVTVEPDRGDLELANLLDRLEGAGVVPSAVWLVPAGVAMPKPAPLQIRKASAQPKRGGSDAHPLIQFDFGHECTDGVGLLDALALEKWVSRSALMPRDAPAASPSQAMAGVTATAAVADRQYADLGSLLRQFRAGGHAPSQIRLSGFGDLRIECEFAHLCGEVEYSKPPEKKKPAEKAQTTKTDAEKKPPKKEEPFVPKPVRPASSSNARQAIERAVASVGWIREGVYHDYHTRFEFNGPRKTFLSLGPTENGVVRIDELIAVLTRAGFPPTGLRVSRRFAGIQFGQALPNDLVLTDPSGGEQLIASFRRPDRPLVLAFIYSNCPKSEKYKADPALFRPFLETTRKFADRVDFIAVSSNPDDDFTKVGELMEKAGLGFPLLHDAGGTARAVLNAQITPAPHLYIFDAEGLLRYAGDPHDNWEKPEEPREDYLTPALDLVLAGRFRENGAVFYHSSKCSCASPQCKCPKCGCGSSCRCASKRCGVGF